MIDALAPDALAITPGNGLTAVGWEGGPFTNSSLVVAGMTAHIDVPCLPTLNPAGAFTVEFWSKPNQSPHDYFCPVSSVDDTQNGGSSRCGWVIYEAAGSEWVFRLGNGDGYVLELVGGLPMTVNLGSLSSAADGTYLPGTTPGVAGVAGAGFGTSNLACAFGADSAIDVPGTAVAFTGPLTLSAWVKSPGPVAGTESVVNLGAGAYALTIDSGGYRHFVDGTQDFGTLAATNGVTDGDWHNLIALTWTPLGTSFTATTNSVNVQDTLTSGQRFYRLGILPGE